MEVYPILLNPPRNAFPISCKQHNERVYVQNAKGIFQKLLFQTKIFFEKLCYGGWGEGTQRVHCRNWLNCFNQRQTWEGV